MLLFVVTITVRGLIPIHIYIYKYTHVVLGSCPILWSGVEGFDYFGSIIGLVPLNVRIEAYIVGEGSIFVGRSLGYGALFAKRKRHGIRAFGCKSEGTSGGLTSLDM